MRFFLDKIWVGRRDIKKRAWDNARSKREKAEEQRPSRRDSLLVPRDLFCSFHWSPALSFPVCLSLEMNRVSSSRSSGLAHHACGCSFGGSRKHSTYPHDHIRASRPSFTRSKVQVTRPKVRLIFNFPCSLFFFLASNVVRERRTRY